MVRKEETNETTKKRGKKKRKKRGEKIDRREVRVKTKKNI
jgi:hypothetical protein